MIKMAKKPPTTAAATIIPDNVDYSFALEYTGPPLTFDIPKAIPLDLDHHDIPIASVATSASPLLDPLPVAHPLPFDLNLNSSSELNNSSSLISDDNASDNSDNDFDDDDDSSPSLNVTFEDQETSSEVSDQETEISRSVFRAKIKKGICFRCEKGGWFTEKEACLVCDARYCGNCVLRMMGSMPEGRKCVGCIGRRVEDGKREKLGKSSRMLRRLLSSLEVEQVLRAERYCEANQLRAEDVYVNGKQLTAEEMVVLKGCKCPPQRLRPGSYWYDKVSGFWGKEGHKPDIIISPNLNVGGTTLMKNASNGNTGICINNREITKAEMQMLKWAGVPVAGTPQYWVDADGAYREEGQKTEKGNIWSKTGIKLLCSFLSLPVPSKGENQPGEEVNNLLKRAMPNFYEQRTLQKLFLVGYHGSGTSTIFKQAKFLYEDIPFSDDERQSIKQLIQSNIYSYLGILLEGRERFEEESLAERENKPCSSSGTAGYDVPNECDDLTVYSIRPRLKQFSDWLLKVMASGDLEVIFPAATREFAPVVEELWKDAAIQATYNRRSELQTLPSSASYFLEKVVDISRVEYEPSDLDILYADGITSSNGLASTDFLFPRTASDGSSSDDTDQQDTLVRYQLIQLHTKGLGENCKWLDMFEEVRIVIFCVSLSDYDEFYEVENGVIVNKMMESKRLFESIISHYTFNQMDFLLLLNNFDLMDQKIECSPLTVCDWFDDFSPVTSQNPSNNTKNYSRKPQGDASKAQLAFHYTAVKFKKLFASITGRKLYVSSVNGLEPDSVDAALRYAKEILKWEEEQRPYLNEFTSYEQSSFDQ